jgi:hypothetical protein
MLGGQRSGAGRFCGAFGDRSAHAGKWRGIVETNFLARRFDTEPLPQARQIDVLPA